MIGGCSDTPRPRRSEPTPAPSTAHILADWDSLDASIEVGAARSECSVGSPDISPDGLQRRYKLKHVSGRVGVLTVRSEAATPDPRSIELSCQMSPFRDPTLESAIIRHISHRIDQLRGKAFAPSGEE